MSTQKLNKSGTSPIKSIHITPFTLIESLVVIAIIAILAGLLLPESLEVQR